MTVNHTDDPIDARARTAADRLIASFTDLDTEAALQAARRGSTFTIIDQREAGRTRWIAVAAAAALIIGGTVALAATRSRTTSTPSDSGVVNESTVPTPTTVNEPAPTTAPPGGVAPRRVVHQVTVDSGVPQADGTVLAALPWGSGDGQVGRGSGSPVEFGPLGFAVLDDASVVVSDPANARLVAVGPEGDARTVGGGASGWVLQDERDGTVYTIADERVDRVGGPDLSPVSSFEVPDAVAGYIGSGVAIVEGQMFRLTSDGRWGKVTDGAWPGDGEAIGPGGIPADMELTASVVTGPLIVTKHSDRTDVVWTVELPETPGRVLFWHLLDDGDVLVAVSGVESPADAWLLRLDEDGSSRAVRIDSGWDFPDGSAQFRFNGDSIDVMTTDPTGVTVTRSPIPSGPSGPDPTTSTIVPELPATWSEIAASTDVAWESSGIARACGMVWWEQQQMEQERCTAVMVDPAGVPVSYDPTTRVITRHARDGGPVEFRLPDEYVDPSLIAAGPDDVVYFALDNEWPKASDVLAVSVNPDDAGTVLERFSEVMGIGDADLFLAPDGLVLSDWYAQGPRPAPDAVPFVEWVERDDRGANDPPLYYGGGTFDGSSGTVTAAGWQWYLGDDRLIQGGSVGDVLATHDGGFITSSLEHDGELRAEMIRGYRDGSVEHWLLPSSWFALGIPVLEPQGTILVPNGNTFARIAPFASRPNGWDGVLQVDTAAGTAEAVGLNEYLDGVSATFNDLGGDGPWPWYTGPTQFANALAGPTQPAETRTVRLLSTEGASSTVAVTTEGFLDDSVFGTQLIARIAWTDAGMRVDHIDWTNSCQPGRGHQDYQPDLCI